MAEKSRIEGGESKSPPPRTYSRSVGQKIGDYAAKLRSYVSPTPTPSGSQSARALADRKDQIKNLSK